MNNIKILTGDRSDIIMKDNICQTESKQSIKQFVTYLKEKNIELWVNEQNLCYKAPRGIVTTEILKQMSEIKKELISYISSSAPEEKIYKSIPKADYLDNIHADEQVDKSDEIQRPSKQIDYPYLEEIVSPSSKAIEGYPQAMELKIVMQRDITTYLHRSLPLCVILAYEKYLPWYYSNFIQIFSFTDKKGCTELNYLESRDCCSEIVEMICLGYHLLKGVQNIIDFIIEKINMGYYIIINVDEYYLSNKWYYQVEYYVHSSLIYGYDNKKELLKAIGFNKEASFTEITFDYTQFIEAYENGKIHYKNSAPWCEWSALQLIKPKAFEVPYPFCNDRFLKELKNYLFSICDNVKLYSFEYYEDQVEFGFQVYDVVIKHLENFLQGHFTIDYRAIHLLSEHKKCLYDRLKYVISQNNLSGEIITLAKQYLKVVNQFNVVRLKSLKSFGNPNISILTLTQKNTIKDIIQMIKELKNTEFDILLRIYQQLDLDLGYTIK